LVEPPSRFSLLIEHDLFGKPLHTFPDHAPDNFGLRASGIEDAPAGTWP